MILHISKVLITLFLLTFCINISKSKKFDIFSIVDDNTLQRKTQYTVKNDNSTKLDSQYPSTRNGEKLLRYLSLVSDEMNDINNIEQNKFKEDPVQLSSAYMDLSDEIMFHGISFDDFTNFKKAAVRMETIIPDGSDANTIKIVYDSKINEMFLSGLAKINGTDYDFVLNITDLTLREEHERSPAVSEGKIVTKSILETLSFKTFTMLIVLKDENKYIRSPNRPILRHLADSWLVTIVNVIDKRFVQPKITEQSQYYFKNYKNTFLESLCSPILTISKNSKPFSQFDEDKNLLSEDSNDYEKYLFRDITFNISSFTKCKSKSISVEIEKDSSQNNDFYLHTLFFIFTCPSTKKSQRTFFNWTFQKVRGERHNNYYRPSYETPEEQCSTRVKYWSVNLKVITDKYGLKTDYNPEVEIDIKLENDDSTKFNNLTNKFLEPFKKAMADSFKTTLDQMLIITEIVETDRPVFPDHGSFLFPSTGNFFRSREYVGSMRRKKLQLSSTTGVQTFDSRNHIKEEDRRSQYGDNETPDNDDDLREESLTME